MRAPLLVALLCAVTACGSMPAPIAEGPSQVKAAEAAEGSEQGDASPKCKRLDRTLLKQATPAQGNVLQCFSVCAARTKQIEQQNHQLAAIAAALASGCIE